MGETKEIVIEAGKTVRQIFFMSDIHINNNNEYDDEYRSVFNKLFIKLDQHQINSDDLVVLVGDILDDGTVMSASCITLVKYFYHELTNRCPVISILGNHDYKKQTNLLVPSVDYLFPTKHKNIFLLENAIYIYRNIAFGHTRFDSSEVTNCEQYNDEYMTIALYHGTINGCKMENNYIARTQFNMKNFKDYKFCAFGDVHRHQFLNKNKTAFYCGSLIMQKKNEIFEHGIVKLDVKNENISFHEIENEYKILNITIDDGKSNFDINKITTNNTKDKTYKQMQLTHRWAKEQFEYFEQHYDAAR